MKQTMQAADHKEKWVDPYHEKDMERIQVEQATLEAHRSALVMDFDALEREEAALPALEAPQTVAPFEMEKTVPDPYVIEASRFLPVCPNGRQMARGQIQGGDHCSYCGVSLVGAFGYFCF